MDADLAETFARQHGLLTTRQARLLGVTSDGARHRVATGRWERVRPGLYRLAGSPVTRGQSIMGAVLLAGDPAWASHFTGFVLWGYRGFDQAATEVSVPLGRRPRVAGVRIHRSGTLDEDDLRTVDGIPVLSAARTIVDVSARFDDAALGRLIDDGLRQRVVTLSALHALTRRLPTIAPGRSPQRMARMLAPRTVGFHPGESELESKVLRLIVDHGFPAPVRQFRVRVKGRTYFLDFAYPEAMLAIEVDGFEFHRERDAFDHDRRRQNDLIGAGWTVLRFTSNSTDREILDAVRPFVFGP